MLRAARQFCSDESLPGRECAEIPRFFARCRDRYLESLLLNGSANVREQLRYPPTCRRIRPRSGWSRRTATPERCGSCPRSSKPVRRCPGRSISGRRSSGSWRFSADHHGAIRSTVVLLNDQTGDVQVEASAGAIQPGKRVRYRLGEGITGRVVESGKPIVVPRVSREPMFLNRAAERPELPQQELSYVSAPITLEGTDCGRGRNRPAVQSRPRLSPDGEVSRRGRVDDRAGGEGPPTDRSGPAAAASTRTPICGRS